MKRLRQALRVLRVPQRRQIGSVIQAAGEHGGHMAIENDDAIRALRRENALLAISRLPDVVLEYIFLLNVIPMIPDIDEAKHPRTASEPISQMLAVSGVCHHWRIVALGYPLLWNHCLDFDKPEGPPLEVFNRSHPCPIDADTYRVSQQSFAKLTGSALILERLRKIAINMEYIPPDTLKAFLQVEKPSLESFEIHGSQIPEVFQIYLFPGEMLANLTSLRELAVGDYVVLDPTSLPMSTRHNLAQLRVWQYSEQFQFPVSQWLDVLANMPNLTELDLGVTISPAPISIRPEEMLYDLPNLRSLTFDNSISIAGAFLHHLRAPMLISLSLKMSENDANPHHAKIFAFIERFIQRWEKERPMEHQPVVEIADLFVGSKTCPGEWYVPTNFPYLSVSIQMPWLRFQPGETPRWTQSLALRLLRIMHDPVFRKAKQVKLDIPLRLSSEEGRSFLSEISSTLQNIQVIEAGPAFRPRTLAYILKYWNQHSLLPNLTGFEFPPELFGVCSKKEYFFESLLDFIRQREKMGMKIQYVSIPEADFLEGQLERLSELVEVKGGKRSKLPYGHDSERDSLDSDT